MALVVLHLLDSERGRPLQTWRFENRDTITVGRAEDNDVIVSDPYVSRAHAYLKQDGGGWKLTSISRQQIVCHGQTWAEVNLSDGSIFRLGPNGCFLRFGDLPQAPTNNKTMSFEPTLMPIFQLDREEMEREVNQIADANYFRQLEAAAQHLRNQREVEDTHT